MKTSTRRRTADPVLAIALAVSALVLVPTAALGVAGDFGEPATSPETVGDAPLSIAAANLVGDANTDLAVLNAGATDSISIRQGDGTGDFVNAGGVGVGNGPDSLVAADFDGDTDVDLATANTIDLNVSILLNNGSGTFAASAGSPEASGSTQIPSPTDLVAANVDGDADTDLIAANQVIGLSDNVTVLLNNGSADFTAQAPEDLNSSIDPHDLAVANLGGDANLDLAIANGSGPTSFADRIGIMIGDGTGNFTDALTSPESAASTLPGTQIVAGDFNGSGGPDLAVTNTSTDDVTTLLNSGGAGDFVAAGPPEAVGDTPTAIVTADVNNDAKTDLVVANSVADNVSVLLGNGAGDFTAAPSSPETTGDFPAAIAVGSLGGNASADLAVTNSFSDNVTILLNEFAAPVVPPPGGGSPATPVTPLTPATPAPATAKAKKKCKKKKGKKGAAAAKKKKC